MSYSQTNQLKKKVIQMVNLLTLLKGIRQTTLTHVVVLARMEAATSVCSNMYIRELHKFGLKFWNAKKLKRTSFKLLQQADSFIKPFFPLEMINDHTNIWTKRRREGLSTDTIYGKGHTFMKIQDIPWVVLFALNHNVVQIWIFSVAYAHIFNKEFFFILKAIDGNTCTLCKTTLHFVMYYTTF